MSDILIPTDFDKSLLEVIDRQDTISTLIDKLNHNFNTIIGAGIFDPKEDEEEEHDRLCDALLIKPHPPIHRRKKILEPLDDRKDVTWLNNVDFLLGDVAIVEQKRPEDSTSNRVYMYTIAKSTKEGQEIELIYETELTGPTGKNAEIYLTYESQELFERTVFNNLTVDKLNVGSISFMNSGKLTATEIITKKLSIGNLTFYSSGSKSELATNKLKVDEIYGFTQLDVSGETNPVTFRSPIIVEFISALDYETPIRIQSEINVDKISCNPENFKGTPYKGNNFILVGSPLKSDDKYLQFDSYIQTDGIKSRTGVDIEIETPIKVNKISTYDSSFITVNSPIKVDKISSNSNSYVSIESPINSTSGISFITPVTFKKDITVDENQFHYKQFDFVDKFTNYGQIFLGLEGIDGITIPEFKLDESTSLSKIGTPYSIVPTDGTYYLAKVTSNGEVWYMLAVKSTRTNINNVIRIVSDVTEPSATLGDEDIYELIASNDIYKNIFESFGDRSVISNPEMNNPIMPISNNEIETMAVKPKYKTIGFTKISTFGTIYGCDIEIKQIPSYTNMGYMSDGTPMSYYITLY